MNMQEHILRAMWEQFEKWDAILAAFSEQQLTAPLAPSDWSVKDNLVHLWTWQLRTVARLEAALENREPVLPALLNGASADEEDVDAINAEIFEANRAKPWSQVYREWRAGRLRAMELGALFPERVLLDGGRYPWLGDLALADLLLGTYDHHQEHLDILYAWLEG